jgi:hypothetical protein
MKVLLRPRSYALCDPVDHHDTMQIIALSARAVAKYRERALGCARM